MIIQQTLLNPDYALAAPSGKTPGPRIVALEKLLDRKSGLLPTLRELAQARAAAHMCTPIKAAWGECSRTVKRAAGFANYLAETAPKIGRANEVAGHLSDAERIRTLWATVSSHWDKLWPICETILTRGSESALTAEDEVNRKAFKPDPPSAPMALLIGHPSIGVFPICGQTQNDGNGRTKGAILENDGIHWVRVQHFNDGAFECVPHPLDDAQLVDQHFLNTASIAWAATGNLRKHSEGTHSVVWEFLSEPRKTLMGPSAGAAFGRAFGQLFQQRKVDPRILVSAELAPDGSLQPVDGIAEKTHAAVMSNAAWLEGGPGKPFSEIDRLALLPHARNGRLTNLEEGRRKLEELRKSQNEVIRKAAFMIDLWNLEDNCSVPVARK